MNESTNNHSNAERLASGGENFHSQFEGIEHPRLVLEHTPGWTWQDTGDTISAARYLFRSIDPDFGFNFSVIERADGSTETALLGDDWDEVVDAEDLARYGDRTTAFAQWLDDCSTVTAWIRAHEGEAGS